MEKSHINFTLQKFKKIFDNKGLLAPFAEFANKNLTAKFKNEDEFYYFTIGHINKHIDTKNLYGFEYDETSKDLKPTRFLMLQKNNYLKKCSEAIKVTLEDIRNINAHYVHRFDKLNLNIPQLKQFIKEAFELSSLISFLDFKKITASTYFINQDIYEHQYLSFLCKMFYTNEDYQNTEREDFLTLNKSKAIEEILFINNQELITWKINGHHEVFDIDKGVYLSHNAYLFLINLFLYKSEAEKLLSKVRGFKGNNSKELVRKRELFTFLSKKVSSQDIDSEARNLVKFRDIIQYLNKYPVSFNEHLETNSKVTPRTENLINHIFEAEIERLFSKDFNKEEQSLKEKFIIYFKEDYFKQYNPKYKKERLKTPITYDEKKHFDKIIEESAALKGERKKLKDLIKVNSSDIEECKKKIKQYEEENINTDLDKLKLRIKQGTLIASYGRNQDRFMQFATRYLAEKNYFGEEAEFKCYQFYTTEEEKEFLKQELKIKEKKAVDKLKYHKGKLVHFTRYAKKINKYPNWDIPFVEENNSITVQIELFNKVKEVSEKKYVVIQRSLMIYLLEHALGKNNSGKILLSNYLSDWQKEYNLNYKTLTGSSELINKKELAKFFPKKILNNLCQSQINHNPIPNKFKQILVDTNEQHEKFNALLKKAKDHNEQENFLKKNKGKQYKLRFIRKAWDLLYFKKIYRAQVNIAGKHHKGFHITRAEFNDFCKWMYGFENVPQYKICLEKIFIAKSFLQDSDFSRLFKEGKSLDDWYVKTRIIYEKFLKENDLAIQSQKQFNMLNYNDVLNNKMMFINLSHFISFLRPDEATKKKYHYLHNENFLNYYYYQTDKETDNKLFNKLNKAKLEDTLLYEMAIKYLDIAVEVNKIKKPVRQLLIDDVTLKVSEKNNNKPFKIILPFKQIDQLAGVQASNLSKDLTNYLELNKKDKLIKSIFEKFNTSNTISFYDFKSLEFHLISSSVKFTNLFSNLEKYYVCKSTHQLNDLDKVYISLNELMGSCLINFKEYRKRAYHFKIPEKNYDEISKSLETDFIINEFNKDSPKKFVDLSLDLKIITQFLLEKFHNNKNYKSDKKDETIKEIALQQQYEKHILSKRKIK